MHMEISNMTKITSKCHQKMSRSVKRIEEQEGRYYLLPTPVGDTQNLTTIGSFKDDLSIVDESPLQRRLSAKTRPFRHAQRRAVPFCNYTVHRTYKLLKMKIARDLNFPIMQN